VVATPPQYLTRRGRPVLTIPPPNILTSVLFFSLQQNFYEVYRKTKIHGTHESWKQHTQNAPYHTILRRKIHKFSGKGHGDPPQCSSGADAHAYTRDIARSISVLFARWDDARYVLRHVGHWERIITTTTRDNLQTKWANRFNPLYIGWPWRNFYASWLSPPSCG